MNKIIKVFFLSLFNLIGMPSHAMVSAALVKAKEKDQQILVIGTCHYTHRPEADRKQATQLVETLRGEASSQPVALLAEMSPFHLDKKLSRFFEQDPFMQRFTERINALKKEGKTNIVFIAGDDRNHISDNLVGLFTDVHALASMAQSEPDQVNRWITHSIAQVSELKPTVAGGICSSVEEYFQYLEANLTKLKAFQSKHAPGDQLVEEHIQNFLKAQAQIKQLLSKAAGNWELNKAILGLFLTCDTKNKLFSRERELRDHFLKYTDFNFATFGMLTKIFENLRSYPRIVVVTGDEHAINLRGILEHLRMSTVQSKSIVKYSPQTAIIEKNDGPLVALVLELSKKFVEDLKLEAKAAPILCCAQCLATPEKLLCCGRCKNIRYCGNKCQVEDWDRHKKECQSAEMANGK